MDETLNTILDLWDFSDPEGSENRFKELLEDTDYESQKPKYLEYLTQIVRAKGLQMDFEGGHKILNEYKVDFKQSTGRPKIRYHLERGRLLNSNNRKEQAQIQFEKAWRLCLIEENIDFLKVDVAHMLAIVEDTPTAAIEWNRKAIAICEESNNPKVTSWLGSLYNNTGWVYHDLENYNKALDLFQKAYDFFEKKQKRDRLKIAKWTIGRVKRSLGKIDEALEIQHELEEQAKSRGEQVDGYTLEELGELYYLKNETDKSKEYFTKAYSILSKDPWLQKNEKKRLDRMKKLSSLS